MFEELRIGVFVCRCGSNISAVVDILDLVKYTKHLKHVVLVDEGKWSCSVDYLRKFRELVNENSINRVVIASCSPRTHEPLFKRALSDAGVNPYFLEFVSIREQVSWVHMNQRDLATQKAKDLVRMGVCKAALLEEGFEIKLPVGTNCLIIGGGITGMSAALSLANQGFHVFLVERTSCLGGITNQSLFVASDGFNFLASKVLSKITNKIVENLNIDVFTCSEIEAIDGYVGNYNVELSVSGLHKKLLVDTIVVATGMEELRIDGQFCYGFNKKVITQNQLEILFRDKDTHKLGDVVIINCVNSKNDERGCCVVGCHISLKNAIALKKLNKHRKIVIMYRDFSINRKNRQMLLEARKLGIIFVRFSMELYPKVVSHNDCLLVEVFDILLKNKLEFKVNDVVLTTAFVGSECASSLKNYLKVSANNDGFFQEAHVKLKPLEFSSDGIGLCGCAKQPMFFKESINEGIGAAMRVSIPMHRGYIKAEGVVASIDIENCNCCELCLKNCPYNAILLNKEKYPEVVKALCKGCGLCAADCPTSSISVVHYSDQQIFAQIDAALEIDPSNVIVGFVCHWCALGGVDMAGVGRLQYPTNARLIRLMCSARVSIAMLLRAFDLGAAGVLVVGCEFPTCHYITGNYVASKRIDRARRKLEKRGFDSSRLWTSWCSAADGPKFARVMNNMANELGLLSD